MVVALRITMEGVREVHQALAGIGQFPELTADALQEWGQILAKNEEEAAAAAGLTPFMGRLFGGGIRWEQSPNGHRGQLVMPIYALAQDQMQPHWVRVDRDKSTLLWWTLQKGSESMRKNAEAVVLHKRSKFFIHVNPHPFIREGYDVSRPLLMPLIRRRLSFARSA
jgi:hypothetical protein